MLTVRYYVRLDHISFCQQDAEVDVASTHQSWADWHLVPKTCTHGAVAPAQTHADVLFSSGEVLICMPMNVRDYWYVAWSSALGKSLLICESIGLPSPPACHSLSHSWSSRLVSRHRHKIIRNAGWRNQAHALWFINPELLYKKSEHFAFLSPGNVGCQHLFKVIICNFMVYYNIKHTKNCFEMKRMYWKNAFNLWFSNIFIAITMQSETFS